MSILIFPTKSDLSAYTQAVDQTLYSLFGENVMGDVPVRKYTYYEGMTEPANGYELIAATGMGGVGRYFLYDPLVTKDLFAYAGRTDVDGDFTIVYQNPFIGSPHVQPSLITSDHLKIVTVVSSDENGCTINVKRIVTQVVEQVEWLTADTVPVENELVNVLIVSR